MAFRPMIVVTPSNQPRGVELEDLSVSLSQEYPRALLRAGAAPLILSCMPDRSYVAEVVSQCDGVLLTGGDDIQPELYDPQTPAPLRAMVKSTDPERDLFELLVIEEVFRQPKPLFAICRGHQILNVAFGGTLFLDLPTQVPDEVGHRQFERQYDPVHAIDILPGSLLARVLGRRRIGVNSTHHQAVDRVAEPFAVTARSRDGVVEACELAPGSQAWLPWFLSVQFHPERIRRHARVFGRLFEAFVAASAETRRRSAGHRVRRR